MAPVEPETADSVVSMWTRENLQKLLDGIKACVPKGQRMTCYRLSLKAIDWEKVMFPPFSPEECRNKWMQIMEKIRKSRSLLELIVDAEHVITTPRKIDMPKRPAPPNAAYFKENADEFRKQHPEMSVQQLLKFSVKQFNHLSVEEKAKYKRKYMLANEEYKCKMQNFGEQNPKSQKKKRKVSADNGDKDFPVKPPKSGYLLFCKEQSSSIKTKGRTKHQHVKEWAQLWQNLSHKQKAKYIKRSNELRKKFAAELVSYVKKFDAEKQQQILQENGITLDKKSKVKEMSCATLMPNEPKMPSKSGNVIFCQHQMKLLKNEIPNTIERFGKVNQMWRKVSAKEKEYYSIKANERIRKYIIDLKNWFETLTAEEQEEYEKSNPSKVKYLEKGKHMKVTRMKEIHLYLPSDSEDEMTDISSSEEEETVFSFENDGEDDAEDFMFEM